MTTSAPTKRRTRGRSSSGSNRVSRRTVARSSTAPTPRQSLREMLEQRRANAAAPPPQTPEMQSGGAVRSLEDLANDPDLTKPVDWDLYPYTARERLTLLASPPKKGKTTFAAHYAAAKARGGTFLGQKLEAGPVLWVAPDEHVADQVRRFLDLLDEGWCNIHIWVEPNPAIEEIVQVAKGLEAELIILDTLPRIACIYDENDNAAWTRWSNDALPLIRASGAAWLVLHHHRKSGGQSGQAIRGGSAIFGLVDIAISLESGSTPVQRRLVIDGTRLDWPEELVVELRHSEYVVIGEAPRAEALQDDELKLIWSALTTTPAAVGKIVQRLEKAGKEIPETTVRRKLDRLVSRGFAHSHGHGGQRDPKQYSSTDLNPWGMEERSSEPEPLHRSSGRDRSGGGATEAEAAPKESRTKVKRVPSCVVDPGRRVTRRRSAE